MCVSVCVFLGWNAAFCDSLVFLKTKRSEASVKLEIHVMLNLFPNPAVILGQMHISHRTGEQTCM